MHRSNSPESDERAARAFARVGYEKMQARLYLYATCVLHLAAVDARRAGLYEALELVDMLFLRVLEGTVAWALAEDATEEEITRYACVKLFGMLSTLRRGSARTFGGDAVDELADDAPDALTLLLMHRGVTDVKRALSGDAEAWAYIQGMLEGGKRAQIAAELGCTAEHGKVIRKRIMRCAAALHAMNDNGEDEPPSSDPRRSHDELPTAQERHRALHEPPRGALRAGGRRR
jgi:hypothetical protein